VPVCLKMGKIYFRRTTPFLCTTTSKEPWQELADIFHLCPTDFQCEWFLDVTFGKPVPEANLLKVCENLNTGNVVDILVI